MFPVDIRLTLWLRNKQTTNVYSNMDGGKRSYVMKNNTDQK